MQHDLYQRPDRFQVVAGEWGTRNSSAGELTYANRHGDWHLAPEINETNTFSYLGEKHIKSLMFFLIMSFLNLYLPPASLGLCHTIPKCHALRYFSLY